MSCSFDRLPDEILLQILNLVAPHELWMSVRQCNKQLFDLVQEISTQTWLKKTSISSIISLASGQAHRWYDIRATITSGFIDFVQSDRDIAVFDIVSIKPEAQRQRALQLWQERHLISDNSHQSITITYSWRVELNGERQYITLHTKGADGDTAISLHWKQMFTRYFEECARIK